ncbi:restriction endonuclease subunit S [Endozoicomonas ascidiicola]|uniref:restriction endonuclease subunit S n=1 Tax=Endozoicomonas ascidiicola TaxID=1698521 RepID=UPI000AB33F97|nr:restriction endonuclease subunit S [Endozoicomonas ascidiicola]
MSSVQMDSRLRGNDGGESGVVMGRYTAYPEYKDSGVEWLGEVPAAWSIFSGKRIFKNARRQALPSDPQLAASQKYGVIPQNLMMELNDSKVMLALKGTESFRHIEKNNFVISLRSFEGGIEHSAYVGCVSPAYTVLSASKVVFYRYYKYLLKSAPYISALQASTDSLRDGKSITYEQFGEILLPLPDHTDQASIANFLDHETAKIDTLIEEQQSLIRLLKEKRQAVISHAVTKGLNPQAPMKDSGVEWLGEVPEHWRNTEIRYITSQMGGGTPSKERLDFWNGNIPWVSPKDMKVDYIEDAQDKITHQAVLESSTKLIPEGSVLIVVRGMILVHSVPVALTQKSVTINQDMKALIPAKGIDGEFLLFFMKGLRHFVLDLVEESAHGTKCLRSEVFERMKIAIPEYEEQVEIVALLKERLNIIDSLIDDAQEGTVLLQERRTALISAAVTGKIDVRHWVAPAEI